MSREYEDTNDDARRESRLRGKASRQGFSIRKSRVREPNLDNLGGYMLIETDHNIVVSGERFDLSLDDIEAYLAGE